MSAIPIFTGSRSGDRVASHSPIAATRPGSKRLLSALISRVTSSTIGSAPSAPRIAR